MLWYSIMCHVFHVVTTHRHSTVDVCRGVSFSSMTFERSQKTQRFCERHSCVCGTCDLNNLITIYEVHQQVLFLHDYLKPAACETCVWMFDRLFFSANLAASAANDQPRHKPATLEALISTPAWSFVSPLSTVCTSCIGRFTQLDQRRVMGSIPP